MRNVFCSRCLICVCVFQVLGWLEEKLPVEKNLPSTLGAVVAPLYSCLEDRSGDVRKKAQAVVPLMMQHVGWDTMCKQANKLKVRFLDIYVTCLLGGPYSKKL